MITTSIKGASVREPIGSIALKAVPKGAYEIVTGAPWRNPIPFSHRSGYASLTLRFHGAIKLAVEAGLEVCFE